MEKKNNFLNNIKKFWNFIWNGDSLLSWITFILVVFVFIRFIFFPGMMLITGSSLPLAIVESCSMYHDDKFDVWWEKRGDWYENRGISKEQFESFSLENGFNKGDIFLIVGVEKEDIELGDTIIFQSSSGRPIIHRVVNLDPLETKGDNNNAQFSLNQNGFVNPERIDETNINENQLIGKATFVRIPYLGWVKLIVFEPFRASGKGFCEQQ